MIRTMVWGTLVFVLTLLLNLPAAFVVRQFAWSPDWQPGEISGSLWDGQMTRLGAVGPLAWKVEPWARAVRLSVAFQQRNWDLSIHGWPWDWQAQLVPGAVRATPTAAFLLAGQWNGGLQLSGSGRICRSSEGALNGSHLTLLTPWMINLGATRIQLECRDGLKLRADLQLDGMHRFDVEADVGRQRLQIDGWAEPGAALTPLLVQSRWLSPGEKRFSKVLGVR